MNNQNKKTTIRGITKIKNEWKNHDVTINQVELENGDISGTFEGELNMVESKLSNNQLLKYLDKKFDAIDKKFEAIDKKFEAIDKKFEAIDKRLDAIDKRLDNIDSKINLILATPTMQREIDHLALNKLQ